MSLINFSSSSNLPEYIWILVNVTPALGSNCSNSALNPRNLKYPFFAGGSSPTPLVNMTHQWANAALMPITSYLFIGGAETVRSFKDCPTRTRPTIPSVTYQWRVFKKINPCVPQNAIPPICQPGFMLSKTSTSVGGCPTILYECITVPVFLSSCCLDDQARCNKCSANQDCIPNSHNTPPSKIINGVRHSWIPGSCRPRGGIDCPQAAIPLCGPGKTLQSINVNLPNGCVIQRHRCV